MYMLLDCDMMLWFTQVVFGIFGNEETQLTKLLNQFDLRPRLEPALELHSRTASSVGIMYRYSGPNTGSSSRGGRIQKKVKTSILIL